MAKQAHLIKLVCYKKAESGATDEPYLLWNTEGQTERLPSASGYWEMKDGQTQKLGVLKEFPEGKNRVMVELWEADSPPIDPDDCYGRGYIYDTDTSERELPFTAEGANYVLVYKVVDL